jgi:hypothetical protein
MCISTPSLTWALDGVCGQRHTRSAFPREGSRTNCVGGSFGSRADLDGCEKPLPNGIRCPGRPARTILCTVEAILAYLTL